MGGGAQRGHQKVQPYIHGQIYQAIGPSLPTPTVVDNIVTWDRAVLAAALVAGFDMDIARLLLAVIHERAF